MTQDVRKRVSRSSRRLFLSRACRAVAGVALFAGPVSHTLAGTAPDYANDPGESVVDYLHFKRGHSYQRAKAIRAELWAKLQPFTPFTGTPDQNLTLLWTLWAEDYAPVSLAAARVRAGGEATLTLPKPGSIIAIESGLLGQSIRVDAAAASVSLGRVDGPGIHRVRVMGANGAVRVGALIVGKDGAEHPLELRLIGDAPVKQPAAAAGAPLPASTRDGLRIFNEEFGKRFMRVAGRSTGQFVGENIAAIGTGAVVCILMPTVRGMTTSAVGVAQGVFVDCMIGQGVPLAASFVKTTANNIAKELVREGKLTEEQRRVIDWIVAGINLVVQLGAQVVTDLFPGLRQPDGSLDDFCKIAPYLLPVIAGAADEIPLQNGAKMTLNLAIQEVQKVAVLICIKPADIPPPPA